MHRKVAAALVAALALGLASCGSSERTETVSRAQAISRLEAACLAGQRVARGEMRGNDRAAYVAAILASLKEIDDKVGNVETSGRARADFDAYKASVQRRIDVLERIVSGDRADWVRATIAASPVIGVSERQGHDAIVRLGARHSCL